MEYNTKPDVLLPYLETVLYPTDFIEDTSLSPQEKILLGIFHSYDNQNKGWCDAALEEVAKKMGRKKRAIQTQLDKLVKKGYISIIYRNTNRNKDNSERTSIYVFNSNKVDEFKREIELRNIVHALGQQVRIKTKSGMRDVSSENFSVKFLWN